ncbi:MAG: phosphatase PAP2 family protein [Aerococcus sp.]|nr:phosphatase PAP2 family protein [Aerococcus sp.]
MPQHITTPNQKPSVITTLLLLAPFLFFLLWLMRSPESLYQLDHMIGLTLRGVPGSTLSQWVARYSMLGNSYVIVIVAIMMAIIVAFTKHSWRGGWLGLIVVLGPGILNPFIKALVTRPRPDVALRLVSESGYSFPSGHSMGSVIFYGALTILILHYWHPSPRVKKLLATVMTLLVLGIAYSRLYLSVHYFSDVCAGLSLGSAFLYVGRFFLPYFDRPIAFFNQPHK